MTERNPSAYQPVPDDETFARQAAAGGISMLAAIMLFITAAASILEGIAAIAEDEFYVAGISYIYEFDATTWGWVHVVLGVIAIICSIGLMSGAAWARYTAVGIAALVIIANFLSLPYYPAWSILIIVMSVVVIWAVTAWQPTHRHGRT
ncbi:DUF7144 family membrane protein [Nocardia alba]|uniref:DUF7144 domain-containing protein n=1 Tax=Nocardia alba TaxID=225051 RepID=A0A4R1FRM6_9NOCA|nr:hypothetical protein [Nocardia alba]TCJ94988.1 hypothetical protein DFR71_3901 [Nocardia alba]